MDELPRCLLRRSVLVPFPVAANRARGRKEIGGERRGRARERRFSVIVAACGGAGQGAVRSRAAARRWAALVWAEAESEVRAAAVLAAAAQRRAQGGGVARGLCAHLQQG